MKFTNAIELHNGYKIDRPDERNFALYHYEEVSKVQMDGKEKVRDKGGKIVKYKDTEWVWKGYYGNLDGLLNGMIEHKCHIADVETLEQMLGMIKEFLAETQV